MLKSRVNPHPPPEERPARDHQNARWAASATPGQTVLIATGSDPLMRTVMPILTRAGYHVDGLLPKRPVLSAIRLLNPSLVFLDWDSPGDDTMEPAQILKVIRDRTSIPVWVIATHASSEGLTQVLEAGAAGCLRQSHLADDLRAWLDEGSQMLTLQRLEERESQRREAEYVHQLAVSALGNLADFPDAFAITVDWDGRILACGASFAARFTLEAEDVSLFTLVDPDDVARFRATLALLRSPDRGAAFVRGHLKPVRGPAIGVVGVMLRSEPDVSSTSDIKLVLMDAEAPRVADRVLGHLGHLDGLVARLQKASPAFRNLLWLLEVQASLLEAEPAPEDLQMVADHLRLVAREGRQFTDLLSQPSGPQTTDVAAGHRVRRRLHQPAPLLDAVYYLGSLMRRIFPDRITLTVQVDEALRSGNAGQVIPLHPLELRRCLLHLMINARDAVRGEGRVDLSVERSGVLAGGLAVVVRDSGHGIPHEYLAAVFDPTFTTRSDRAGMGLGLAIVRTLVTGVGGQVIVDSVAGEWTRVELHFPPVTGE